MSTNAFSLATFNLENLGLSPHGVTLVDRIFILRPEIERLAADILCLQEVNAEELSKHGERRPLALERLIEGTVYENYYRVFSNNRQGQRMADRHNLAILSRFPVIERRQVWHDLLPPPRHFPPQPLSQPLVAEWDRPFLYAKLDIANGRYLHVLNLHLKAPRASFIPGAKENSERWTSVPGWAEGFHIASMKRTGQALEARLFIDGLLDEKQDALIAVAGDFNADDNESPLRILRAEADDTGNAKLALRSLTSLERALPESQRFSVIHHGRPAMLDHLLVSRPLLGWVKAVAAHNETLGDEALSPVLIPNSGESYHAPLVATFQEPQNGRA